MGTFHHDRGSLHGITVVVESRRGIVVVGRCDVAGPEGVVLLDADAFEDAAPPRDGPQDRAAWLARAAAWGVFPRLPRHVVPGPDVLSVVPLGDWRPAGAGS